MDITSLWYRRRLSRCLPIRLHDSRVHDSRDSYNYNYTHRSRRHHSLQP